MKKKTLLNAYAITVSRKWLSFKFGAILFCLFCSISAFANTGTIPDTGENASQSIQQTREIKGTVIDRNGEPVIGANVSVIGTTTGVNTDINGNFTLNVKPNDVLKISFIGYKPQNIMIKNQSELRIVLTEDDKQLGEVVVTAMGIKRKSETLAYAADVVGGKDVNDIKSINMINSLQGKSAGLIITPNSTGAGGASKILLRGNKSINGNNQPLVVVDGVPLMMNITGTQVDNNYGGQRDGGDAMSTINPDDIASITLLKGASAAALYGAVAANGAIMITTKSAQAGKVSINVSSNTTIENPMVLPEFQNSYGVSNNGTYSWGDKLDTKAPNYLKDFFRTGVTTNNSIALNGGNENIQAYFSYANVASNGITPENNYMSHTFNSKVGFNLFKQIHVDFNAKYVNQHVKNQPASGYLWNPLTGAYLFPRGEDWNGYKNQYEVYDPARGIKVQNWTNTGQQQFGNPYWVLNRMTPISDRNRYEFGGSVTWDITKDLNIGGRLKYEKGDEHFVHNAYASSVGNLYPMGRMKDNRSSSEQLYGDVLVNYSHKFNEISLSATAGSSFTQTQTVFNELWGEGSQFQMNDGKPSGNIYYPNIFTPNNYYSNIARIGEKWQTKKRINSVFATAQIGYHDGLFLDLTARNDWSSTLAFTDDVSFFYPSVGGSFLLNKFVDMGEKVDLVKFRASYSIVGNDVPLYVTNLLYTLGANGELTPPEKAPFKTLKPEKTNSFEVGFDGTFLDYRLNVSFTYYKSNTRNQFFAVSAPFETGLRSRYVNAGNVQNQGVEATAGWISQFTPNFSWSTDLNFSYNDNKIIELVDELPNGLEIKNFGGASVRLTEGGSYGDLYVRQLKRDENGKPLMNDKGEPILGGDATADLKYVGNMNAKVNMGWNNTFRYKDFTLSFLIDAKFGGKVLSMTEATLDGWGVSKRSGDARDNGGVTVDGVTFDPQKYYSTTGNTNFNSPYAVENYVYDATNIRLREMSFGYTFRNLFGIGKNLTAAIIGRNLFFFYKKAPMDPDISASTLNGMQGVDMFSLPTSRSFGLNIKLNF
ncbi:SusC/RagA family TonB-linked outer membrane protein [Coprobacter tertius]|uniref:SusC/RagA family TonB-linked outer membrane protein n=1 Tax=Coprobacter tertius TaxID=2944915 RepID=A0ABT1MIU7_9BACT|nr:SusC/RagA family TonB-linked outer membrane protein [Coprobacter tertius]MCP9612540.1 SusC/RagA family TonB-linked outer membrane protein [Coprobacter tertius]